MSTSHPKITIRESALLGLAAVGVHVVFLMLLPVEWQANNSYDYQRFYEPVASRIVDGEGISEDDGRLATRYPPGYPLILAGVFSLADSVSLDRELALELFVTLTVWLNVFLAIRVSTRFFSRRVTRLAALILATYPFYLWLTKQPNSENVFIGPFLLSILWLDRVLQNLEDRSSFLREAFVCGVICGLMSLIRPISIVIVAVYVGLLWVRKAPNQRALVVRCALAMVIGNGLAVLPWEVSAYRATGRVIPLSTGGAPSIIDGLTFTVIPNLEQNTPSVPADVERVIHRIHTQRDSLETSGQVITEAIEVFKDEPWAFSKLMGIKLIRSWYATNMTWHESATALIQLPYVLLAVIGFVVLSKSGRRGRDFCVLGIGLVLYYWGMTVIALSILRYMIPVMILILPAVAVGALSIVDRLRGHTGPMVVSDFGTKAGRLAKTRSVLD